MKITSFNKFITSAFLAAAVTLLAAAPTAQAAEVSPLSFEISTAYDSAGDKLYDESGKVNTIGVELTGVYALDESKAITLRLGVGYGSHETEYTVHDDYYFGYDDYVFTDKYSLIRVNLMPGFRYTMSLSDKAKCFAGVNAGLVFQNVTNEWTEDGDSDSKNANSIGLGYSAEIGFIYNFSERVSVLAAYQFSGSTNKTELDWGDGVKSTSKQQSYNTIRAGVSIRF